MSISSVKHLVRSVIDANRVVVFSKSYCPFCDLAKTVLKDAGASKHFVVELDERNDSNDLQNELTDLTKVGTVPYVFINKEYIGGGSTVDQLHKDGLLKEILLQENLHPKSMSL